MTMTTEDIFEIQLKTISDLLSKMVEKRADKEEFARVVNYYIAICDVNQTFKDDKIAELKKKYL